MGGIMHLVRQPEAPEITTRQMILLPLSYWMQAILALHNDTHAGAKAKTQMARSYYFWKGLNRDILGGHHQDLPRLSKEQDNQTWESQTGYLPVI